MNGAPYDRLEQVLAYTFRDRRRVERALTHGSFRNENTGRLDNKQLAFFGDAVLQLMVTQLLIENFPEMEPGKLTPMRQRLVNGASVAAVAERAQIGEFLFLGRGETLSGGKEKPSLLAEALEAVIAAVFIDSGFDLAATLMVFRPFLQRGLGLGAAGVEIKDFDGPT